ncbi:invasion associated locus B family protein [Aliishimia ponticola]|uniref:Invasion associated locus B family protein n=1 Tax=Aliishimia ponticola TaxID=2499833 RepID=A0A4S4NG09_9RHOB|nr:invasion associated locus B family protein [Aliishimia ponticola]THH38544.1 invasion associated locus B family protein [Aliishimia ponticola]
MKRTFETASALAICLGMALGAPAFAQDDQTAAPADESTASDVESQLSLGEDADTPTDLGQMYVKTENGDWEMRCLKTETPENDPCQMYQLLSDETGAPVAEFTLFRLPAGGKAVAGATVTVPLETALPNQLTVQIDGGNTKRYPYAFCTQVGCHARIGLTEQDVNAFKRGNEAVLSIVPAIAPDQKVELKMSLSGFTASYDAVSVIEQQ